MEDKMRWFVSYKDGPSLEVSAGKASEFIDLFGKKYRDDIINEEADLRAGKTDLPMTCKLAHELTDLAERGLAVIETGREENETMKESILTASEKEYLSNVIKPFRKDSPITIEKHSWAWGNERECIIIWVSNINNPNIKEIISFPYFKTGEMYRGMEADKEYTLEELGL